MSGSHQPVRDAMVSLIARASLSSSDLSRFFDSATDTGATWEPDFTMTLRRATP